MVYLLFKIIKLIIKLVIGVCSIKMDSVGGGNCNWSSLFAGGEVANDQH